ncbi:MAG: histidinol-phosphate transaminase [Woeseia sp.]
MTIELLARPEIRELSPYQTAKRVANTVRLNANEAPSPPGGGATASGLNRYPEIRPARLHERLASHYGVTQEKLLATRGSSEAIDLLVRAFCRSGRDSIVVTPPTFSMYRVYADVQGARTLQVPLLAGNDFSLDAAAVIKTCCADTKLIFICSPNNPTGGVVPHRSVIELAEARRNRSLIVVDEAYAEFSGEPSATALLPDYDNIVVLRTLSKALSLAGVRCGAVLANPPVIRLLDSILAPYALSTPVVECVLEALSASGTQSSRDTIERTIQERGRVGRTLAAMPQVRKVWPSRGNFLLVRFRDLKSVQERLQQARILIRDFGDIGGLGHCARITIGNPEENDLLLSALSEVPEEN